MDKNILYVSMWFYFKAQQIYLFIDVDYVIADGFLFASKAWYRK